MSTRTGNDSKKPNRYYRINLACTRVVEVIVSESGSTNEIHYYFSAASYRTADGGEFRRALYGHRVSEHEEYFYSRDELLEFVANNADDAVRDAFLQEFV